MAVLPELSISIIAAIQGISEFGLGLIFGGNVADLMLITGIVLIIAGKVELKKETRKNILYSSFFVLLPLILLIDGDVSRLDGLILIVFFIILIIILLKTQNNFDELPIDVGDVREIRHSIEISILLSSLLFLGFGGYLITTYTHEISRSLNFPLFFIGILLAIVVCLPELFFAIIASYKKNGELGLGNILGNVVIDALLTIGIIAVIQPIIFEDYLTTLFSASVMVIATFTLALFSRKNVLNRKHGVILIIGYIIFLVFNFFSS